MCPGGASRRRRPRCGGWRPARIHRSRWVGAGSGRTWGEPHVLGRKARAGQKGNSSVKQRAKRGDGLVGVAAALVEVAGEELVFLGHVAGADADDETPAREQVDRREFLGGARQGWRCARISTCESRWSCRLRGEPGQRGRRVVPDGAHGVRQPAWDGGVIAHADVEEARVVRARAMRASSSGPDPSPSRPHKAWTGTGSAAACRRRRLRRARPARRRRGSARDRS